MDSYKRSDHDKIYTRHGQKMAQGMLMEINGKKALANFKGNTIVGYTTIDELLEETYTRKLPSCNLEF